MATYSPLTDRKMPPRLPKSSSRHGSDIERVIVHHWAGKNGGIERLVQSSDEASANYLILTAGELIGSVPEEERAWTSSSASADRPSITFEVQNETLAPHWRVSDEAINTLTRTIADIADRYGWPSTKGRVVGHRDFAATACPGPYLYPRLDVIAAAAQALRRRGSAPGPAPAPTPEESVMTPAQEAKLDRVLALLEQVDGALATGVASRSIGKAVAGLPRDTADAVLTAQIGRGSNRRRVVDAIAGTESAVDTALTILTKES